MKAWRCSEMRDDDVVVNVVLFVVCFFGGVGLGSFGVFSDGLEPLLLSPVEQLDDDVADGANYEDCQHHVELHTGAQVCAVGVRYHEARALPESEVGKGGFLVAPEKRPVKPCKSQVFF